MITVRAMSVLCNQWFI